MSESDDTDILLLIPPNYFIATAEENLYQQNLKRMRLMGDAAMMPPPTTTTTAAYQFLPPSRKTELNHINARLHSIDLEGEEQFAAPSDISTISTNTVRTQFGNNQPRKGLGLVHSTPKCTSLKEKSIGNGVRDYPHDGVLLEIDHFLEEDHHYNGQHWHHHSDDYRLQQQYVSSHEPQTTSLPGALNHLTAAYEQQPHDPHPHVQFQTYAPPDNNLISLSEIWGKSGQTTAIAGSSQATIKEEQLRRQHLEKTVRLLQSRLLEYQQRLSVAIEVDRAKDAALGSVQQEYKSLNSEVQKVRDSHSKLETEQKEYNLKTDAFQKELAQAVSLATKFQEKNDKLEEELADYSRKNNERNIMYRDELDELELKLHGCKRSEEFAINELSKLRDKFAKSEHQNEKLRSRCDDLEKDCSTFKQQKEMLQDYHQKQKSRADSLETQRKSLQETIEKNAENEVSLKRKLDLQAKSLKSHYQQQLENVVSQKLKEFQEQLDKTEEHLKTEARDRERLIAERAVKQLELINEKSELELNLLQEKHNEEVELYRIQLANASKKIDELELKLNCYKSKRADIAEKLHDVMETQWQKALEILTSPNQSKQLHANSRDLVESPENNENGLYETPKTSKCRQGHTKENNLNVISNKEQQQPPPMDRLQAYIELLLSKSPSDFDKLDEILALSTKSKAAAAAGKLDKSNKRFSHAKPPWKA